MSRNARAAARGAAGALAIAMAIAAPGAAMGQPASPVLRFQPRSLDGSGNNVAHPTWGEMGTDYQRLAPAHYADGAGAMTGGPNPRYISNRVFNSRGVDLFSERNVSQWVWVWGQFLDHTFGLAEAGTDEAGIPFDPSDPLEGFTDTLGPIPFDRDAVAPGTGTSALESASAGQHGQLLHRRVAHLRRHAAAAGVAADRTRQWQSRRRGR